MNKYLAKLKTAKEGADCFDSFGSAQGRRVFEKNRTADLLPKPPKPAFDSFDSNAGSHFFDQAHALPQQKFLGAPADAKHVEFPKGMKEGCD